VFVLKGAGEIPGVESVEGFVMAHGAVAESGQAEEQREEGEEERERERITSRITITITITMRGCHGEGWGHRGGRRSGGVYRGVRIIDPIFICRLKQKKRLLFPMALS
jgi:hypothetical protein